MEFDLMSAGQSNDCERSPRQIGELNARTEYYAIFGNMIIYLCSYQCMSNSCLSVVAWWFHISCFVCVCVCVRAGGEVGGESEREQSHKTVWSGSSYREDGFLSVNTHQLRVSPVYKATKNRLCFLIAVMVFNFHSYLRYIKNIIYK